jgi:predicted enzyme related to lactoylglutathione lyase
MLNLNSIMIGTHQPKVLGEFYTKVFGKPSDMPGGDGDGKWYGWLVGSTFLNVGEHSEVKGSSQEPSRMILNFETTEVKEEFERIKACGATVVKEPYTMPEWPDNWIATLADPDGNYFQLVSPWKGEM